MTVTGGCTVTRGHRRKQSRCLIAIEQVIIDGVCEQIGGVATVHVFMKQIGYGALHAGDG